VPDDKSLLGNTIPDDKIPDLPLHLGNGVLHECRIVRCIGACPGNLLPSVFCIGHVDVDHSLEKAGCLSRIVRTSGVDKGDNEAFFCGDPDRLEDLGDEMAGGDQVDVMAVPFLKLKHHPRKPSGRDVHPVPCLADLVVLAEDTPHVAPGKKDGP